MKSGTPEYRHEHYLSNKAKMNEQSRRNHRLHIEERHAKQKIRDDARAGARKEKWATHKYSYVWRYQAGKARAKSKNKEFTLPYETYLELVTRPCYYCGASLEKYSGLSLDRIDNARGYTSENVLPCCYVCNTLRNTNFSVEETQIMVQAVMQYRAMR